MTDVNELPHNFSKETGMTTEFLIYGSRVLVTQINKEKWQTASGLHSKLERHDYNSL